jgi:hypothetical protein
VILWDAPTGSQRSVLTGHEAEVSSVSFSSDNHMLASASYDGSVILWDAHSGKRRAVLQGHAHRVRSIAFSPDGKTLALGGDDGVIQWPVFLEDWPKLACRVANRNLTCPEWHTYFGAEHPYEKPICPDLPMPKDWDPKTRSCPATSVGGAK